MFNTKTYKFYSRYMITLRKSGANYAHKTQIHNTLLKQCRIITFFILETKTHTCTREGMYIYHLKTK